MDDETSLPPLVKIERHELYDEFGVVGETQGEVIAKEEIMEGNILNPFLVVEEAQIGNGNDFNSYEEPPQKLRKLNFDKNQENSELVEKLENLNKEIQVMRAELSILMDMVSTQTAHIKQLITMGNSISDAHRATFPIRSEADLIEVDVKITQDNREAFIKKIKDMLIQAPISKSKKKVISEEVIWDYNMDGKSNKKSLRSYASFVSVLLEAIQLTDNSMPAENILRSSLSCVKNSASKSKNRKIRAESVKLKGDSS